jgi:hypothetical protein
MSCSISKYEEIMRAESEAEQLEKNLYYRYMYNGNPIDDMLENPPFAQQETKAQKRKQMPVYSGVLKYFPDALKEVSKASQAGNDQHHPDKPLHWDKKKSFDNEDALVRHLIDHSKDPIDDDGILHLTKVAWRALASLQIYLENNE